MTTKEYVSKRNLLFIAPRGSPVMTKRKSVMLIRLVSSAQLAQAIHAALDLERQPEHSECVHRGADGQGESQLRPNHLRVVDCVADHDREISPIRIAATSTSPTCEREPVPGRCPPTAARGLRRGFLKKGQLPTVCQAPELRRLLEKVSWAGHPAGVSACHESEVGGPRTAPHVSDARSLPFRETDRSRSTGETVCGRGRKLAVRDPPRRLR